MRSVITQADRELVAELAARLWIQDWQIRTDGRGPCFLAGARGTVRVVAGTLIVSLRPNAAAEVEDLRQRLLGSGVLVQDGAAMVMVRQPSEVEAASLRGLLGLHRGWAAAPSVTPMPLIEPATERPE